MEIMSTTTKVLAKGSEKTTVSPQQQKCSFSGSVADFYVGLSDIGSTNTTVRILGAVRSDLVETAINKLLGKGSDEIKWPVVLDMKKNILFHSHEAYQKGDSAVFGWQEYFSKVSNF